jgi:hypothetical protein
MKLWYGHFVFALIKLLSKGYIVILWLEVTP